MTILASQIVAAEALVGVRDCWTDLVRCVCHERMAVLDEPAERIISHRGKVGERPLGKVDSDEIASQKMAGLDQGGGQ